MGTLYVVATPIGNLQDMTPRAVDTLRGVSLIAAEDTRHSGTLRTMFEIETPMISYHKYNEAEREQRILTALASGDVALISDAGTPAIADPGNDLVASVRRAGYPVVPIPGASAAIAAVSASGLVSGPFIFLGFLERRGEGRRQALATTALTGWPSVLFESPNRLVETLGDLAEVFGDPQAIVARELTKVHEEIIGGRLSDLRKALSQRDIRGEIVVVIGAGESASSAVDLPQLARKLLAEGLKPSRAARELASIAGIAGDEAYDVIRSVRPER